MSSHTFFLMELIPSILVVLVGAGAGQFVVTCWNRMLDAMLFLAVVAAGMVVFLDGLVGLVPKGPARFLGLGVLILTVVLTVYVSKKQALRLRRYLDGERSSAG